MIGLGVMTCLVMKDHPNTPMSPQPKAADVKLPQAISTDETYSQRTSSSSINITPFCVASHNGGDCLSPTDMAQLGVQGDSDPHHLWSSSKNTLIGCKVIVLYAIAFLVMMDYLHIE